jgi:hypothetical protein
LPGLAQASSAGYEYQDAVTTPTGAPPSESNLHSGSPSTKGNGSPAKPNANSSAKGSGGQNHSSAKPNASNTVGNGQGNSDNGQEGSANGDKKLTGAEPGTNSGGSSPLVPILIAIVLLAGGSIAYVLMKRRRQRKSPDSPDSSGSSGSSVSPEAG